jgi:putative membrane protein
MSNRLYHSGLFLTFIGALLWSGFHPTDRFTWILEVFPAIAGAVLLVAIYPRFRLTNLAYGLIWVHAIILLVGCHYTYAEMPLFNWLRDTLHLARNYYDRLGHLAQGFIPAIIAREVLVRTSPLRPGRWLTFVSITFCLALSAFYELIEFAVALATGTAAEAFLGTQGDIWDTQWDMTFALVGAIISLALLHRVHDRQLDLVNRSK